MDISPGKQLSKGTRVSSGPKALACYVCGRQTILSSYAIHTKQCKKLFEAREAQKPLKDRKPCPKEPEALQAFLNSNDGNGRNTNISDEIYTQLQKEATKRATLGLCACKNCGRTFLEDKLQVHLKSCSPDNPARRVNEPLTRREGGAAGAVTKNGTVRRSLCLSKAGDDNNDNDDDDDDDDNDNDGNDWDGDRKIEPSSPNNPKQAALNSRPRTAGVKSSTPKHKVAPRRATSARLKGEPFAWSKGNNNVHGEEHGEIGFMVYDGKCENVPIINTGGDNVHDDVVDDRDAVEATQTFQGNLAGSSIMKVLRSLSKPPSSSFDDQETVGINQHERDASGAIVSEGQNIVDSNRSGLSDTLGSDTAGGSVDSNHSNSQRQDGLNLLLRKVEGIESILHQLTSVVREVKMEIMHQKSNL